MAYYAVLPCSQVSVPTRVTGVRDAPDLKEHKLAIRFCSLVTKENFRYGSVRSSVAPVRQNALYLFGNDRVFYLVFLFVVKNSCVVGPEGTRSTRRLCAMPRPRAGGPCKQGDPPHGIKISLILKWIGDPHIRD
jgi:hypothetical protein